jgi:hypothetical protein
MRVKTGGILPYFEDLKRGTNKMKLIRLWRIGPKDIFEIASQYLNMRTIFFENLVYLHKAGALTQTA